MQNTLFGKPVVEAIRVRLRDDIAARTSKPSLGIVYVGENPVIENFIAIKRRFGESIGVSVSVARLAESVSSKEVLAAVDAFAKEHTGVIIQLPLPSHFTPEVILNSVPVIRDIDVLSEEAMLLFEKGDLEYFPGVPGAIERIAQEYNIDFMDKKVVVVGEGRLVGKPVCAWLDRQNIAYTVLRRGDDLSLLREAQIIISGTGVAGLITPEHITPGVIVFDAGTTESNGAIVGDLDPRCFDIVGAYTPVPGGIGPVTVAVLFDNVYNACLIQ